MIQCIINFLNTLQGLRKTIVMALLIAVSIGFRLKGLISGDNLVQLLQSTAIAFFATNGIEHFTDTVKQYISANGKKVEEDVISVSEKSE